MQTAKKQKMQNYIFMENRLFYLIFRSWFALDVFLIWLGLMVLAVALCGAGKNFK